MPTDIAIQNAPDQVVQRLRDRAARHHRSLESEVLVILETAVQNEPATSFADILADVRRLGLNTPDEGTAIIRAARDGH